MTYPGFGAHIRGKVLRACCGPGPWQWRVVNTRTDQVVAYGQEASQGVSLEACHQAVGAARTAVFYGLDRKKLR